MVPSEKKGLEARRRAAGQGGLSSSSRPDGGWRLLVRISQARWVAIALGAVYALSGPHAGVSAWPLLLLVAMATAYNLVVALHRRLPLVRLGTMTWVTVAGDFVWITAASGLLATSPDGASIVIGYVVLGSECGLLMGWFGVPIAVTLAVGALVGLELTPSAGGAGTAGLSGALFASAAVGVSALVAAIGSSELTAQGRELEAKTAALEKHARTDHLTRLGNARAVDEALTSLRGRRYGLLLIDVDGTRLTNVVYGHQAGDELLLGVARVLSSIRERHDVASRMNEDKFVLLLPDADRSRVSTMAEQVRTGAHGVAVSGGKLRVSIGCAWNAGDDDPSTTMSRADDALYAAKAGGGDRVVVQGNGEGRGRWRLREAVQSILESDRGVYSVYQCIVELSARTLVGWEALSRPHGWPANADVEALFHTAHRMGRGRDLDWRCRRNALWEASRLQGSLFVNVNVGGLMDPVHDVDQMLLVCEWAKRDPHTVVLELTEHDAISDLARLRHVLASYRSAGFRFALDDLGEGQTTLEVLLAARPEFLKLARPLVQAAREDFVARSAARALVTFAHDIGSTVIAEGVEDDADRDLCMSLRFDLGQGWLFGRPRPADRLGL